MRKLTADDFLHGAFYAAEQAGLLQAGTQVGVELDEAAGDAEAAGTGGPIATPEQDHELADGARRALD